MKIDSITFKACYVKPDYISIKSSNTKENPSVIEGSFIELDPNNENDLDTMCNLNEHWGFLDTYAFQIFDSMERINKRLLHYDENSKFYALTLQKDNFEKLDHRQILGVTEIVEDEDLISVNFLQADPQNKRNAPLAKYKHIGTTIINSLKSIYNTSDIYLRSTKSARKFYKAMGFVKKSLKSNEYIYTPKKG